MVVRDILEKGAARFAEQTAVSYENRSLTYGQAWDRGLKMANGLLAFGLTPGDRVAVLEDNCLESVDFMLGCAIAGLVRVPLFARNKRRAHAQMLRSSGSKAVVVSEAYAPELEGFGGEIPGLKKILVRDADYESWLAQGATSDPHPDLNPGDLYMLRFTGGTTGEPKGIPLTHRIFVSQYEDWFSGLPLLSGSSAVLHAAPISHASGYWFVPAWQAGGRNIMVSSFNPVSVLDLLQSESVSHLFLPPTAINALCQVPDAATRTFDALKVLQSASAPIAERTVLDARGIFGDTLYHAYGLSELLPVAQMGPEEWFAEVDGATPLRSCGKPLASTQVQIWNERDEPVAIGEAGEVVAKSQGQITGYWQDEEETARRFKDGWLRTGDIGCIDEHGYLYLLDRKSDLIVSGGFNIYPAEIENVITNLHGVVEAAVFGIAHERWGEAPMAVVCVNPQTSEIDEDSVIRAVADELGSYKKPARVVLTETPLPKTPVGKINRRTIRDHYVSGSEPRISGA